MLHVSPPKVLSVRLLNNYFAILSDIHWVRIDKFENIRQSKFDIINDRELYSPWLFKMHKRRFISTDGYLCPLLLSWFDF